MLFQNSIKKMYYLINEFYKDIRRMEVLKLYVIIYKDVIHILYM